MYIFFLFTDNRFRSRQNKNLVFNFFSLPSLDFEQPKVNSEPLYWEKISFTFVTKSIIYFTTLAKHD